ncbi:hypothetical protein ACFRK5_09250 [Streptomyces niveus]|uniref:hypothetical protein n=1 Tax=Streptomyces niveus TaxID=193462 RepID=UPI003688EC9C
MIVTQPRQSVGETGTFGENDRELSQFVRGDLAGQGLWLGVGPDLDVDVPVNLTARQTVLAAVDQPTGQIAWTVLDEIPPGRPGRWTLVRGGVDLLLILLLAVSGSSFVVGGLLSLSLTHR